MASLHSNSCDHCHKPSHSRNFHLWMNDFSTLERMNTTDLRELNVPLLIQPSSTQIHSVLKCYKKWKILKFAWLNLAHFISPDSMQHFHSEQTSCMSYCFYSLCPHTSCALMPKESIKAYTLNPSRITFIFQSFTLSRWQPSILMTCPLVIIRTIQPCNIYHRNW